MVTMQILKSVLYFQVINNVILIDLKDFWLQQNTCYFWRGWCAI